MATDSLHLGLEAFTREKDEEVLVYLAFVVWV
jgi:hypothetical protein